MEKSQYFKVEAKARTSAERPEDWRQKQKREFQRIMELRTEGENKNVGRGANFSAF